MQLGSYLLDDTMAHGPNGAVVAAHADGRAFVVRFLDRVQTDASAWAAVRHRLRLLALFEHPALLQPAHIALEEQPPYLVLPAAEPWDGPMAPEQGLRWAVEFTDLLASAHRLGLTLGGCGELRVLRWGERLVLDLSDTQEYPSAGDFAADVARMGDLLLQLLGPNIGATDTPHAEWLRTVQEMRRTNSDERPLAEEVAAAFRRVDPGKTLDSSDVVATRKANVGVHEVHRAIGRVPVVGEALGRFRLMEKLGEGAIGIVFRGEDPLDGQSVAIKVLKLNALASDKARRRFVKEGRLLAALDTPFVTRLVDVNTEAGIPYIVLEFVAGSSLGEVIRRSGTLPEATALAYIADAARGVAVAHALGMVHRDIKPDNLLLAADGRVKVTDFGMAREIEQSQSLEITHDGATLGTPLYMAPEQFGSSKIDTRADVYALGATLFHLLAGRPPFAANRLSVLAKTVATELPPALDKINNAISPPVAALVARTLAKDPNARPADAAILLDEIERLRTGTQTQMADHPVDPALVGHVRTYSFVWELRSSPAQVWPHVSNTERLNRAIGMPAANYYLVSNPAGGVQRFARARAFIGWTMDWEEHPFEWIEGRRMGILRAFRRGPFAWFISTVDLIPHANGGTTLRHTLRVEPRGFLGRLLAPLQMGKVAGKVLGKVYAQIDKAVQSADPHRDPFEEPTQLPAAKQRVLRQRIEQLAALNVAPEGVQLLLLYLAHAPDQEVARIRPLALAARFGVAESSVIDACLQAVRVGVLRLQWDVICPLCRIPSGRKNTLRELHEHERCPACDKEFQPDFAAAVELVLQVHPEIRRVEVGTYCAGGPAHSPHVVAQTRLASDETIELDLALSEGVYRVRSTQLPWTLELRVGQGSGVRRWDIPLALTPPKDRTPLLGVGGQRLRLQNQCPHEVVVRVERTAARTDALTAARALAVPAFRELFPGELLNPGQLAPAAMVTFVQMEVTGVEGIIERAGEAAAFQHVQAAFRHLEACVKAEGGTVVKSIGDGLLLAFSELGPALRCALECATKPTFTFRGGVQRGLVMVATIERAAQPGELLVSAACAGDPDATLLLAGRTMRMCEVGSERAPLLACRVT
jgi:hypothetical protein